MKTVKLHMTAGAGAKVGGDVGSVAGNRSLFPLVVQLEKSKLRRYSRSSSLSIKSWEIKI